MPCRSKGCAWPPEANGYCVQCQWKVAPLADAGPTLGDDPASAPIGPVLAVARGQPEPPVPAPRGEKWRWLKDGFSALKEGESMEIPVPEGQTIARYQTYVHSNLNGSKASQHNKFHIRRNETATALILTKDGPWSVQVAMGEGVVTCDTCGRRGHTSIACPDRVSQKSPQSIMEAEMTLGESPTPPISTGKPRQEAASTKRSVVDIALTEVRRRKLKLQELEDFLANADDEMIDWLRKLILHDY